MDGEYDVVGGYLPFFTQHLNETAARLGLRIESQASDDHGAVDLVDAHAHSDWTPAEQDAFFRAVSVHSRWRPDLIAACVPTRTEWEVWMYLEALEEGAFELSTQQAEDKDVDMADGTDSRAHSVSNTNGNENICEPALEVSQDWIDAEERMAAWIVRKEDLASVGGGVIENVDKRSRKRPRGRPRGRGRKGSTQSRSRKQTGTSKRSPSPVCRPPPPEATPSSARDASRDTAALDERQRHALMSRLELPHLQVLDSILREGEAAAMGRTKSREGSVNTPMELEDDKMPCFGDMDVSSLSGRVNEPPGANNVLSDAVIDPVLLALSRGAGPTERPSSEVTSESAITSSLHVIAQGPSPLSNSCSQPARLESSFQPETSHAFAPSQDSATLTDPDPTANAEQDISLLSPRTRRRIQKRLYMRRKRLRDNGGAPEGMVITSLEKLKCGRKTRSRQIETSVPGTGVPSEGEDASPENAPQKHRQRGLTLPYKLKGKFAEMGVDAAYLRGQGMDLLHLGALGRLMSLCSSLGHGEEEEGEEPAGSIDDQVIRYLQVAMVLFVMDVVHRAIVWREREIRLKRRSRAWRQSDQITLGAVERAVAVVGARYQSHRAYFKSLEALHGPSTEETSAPGIAAEEEPNPTDECVDPNAKTVDLAGGLPWLSPHHNVYTPLVYASEMSPLSCLTRTYEREATRTRRGTSADIEEELMSDETDEEGLDAALREEDEQDEEDMGLAEREEGRLWDQIR